MDVYLENFHIYLVKSYGIKTMDVYLLSGPFYQSKAMGLGNDTTGILFL